MFRSTLLGIVVIAPTEVTVHIVRLQVVVIIARHITQRRQVHHQRLAVEIHLHQTRIQEHLRLYVHSVLAMKHQTLGRLDLQLQHQ